MAPALSAEEAFEVLPGRREQPLDVDPPQAVPAGAPQPVPVLGLSKERLDPLYWLVGRSAFTLLVDRHDGARPAPGSHGHYPLFPLLRMLRMGPGPVGQSPDAVVPR